MTNESRNAQLRADYEAGRPIAEILQEYNVTRQRMHAIFASTGGGPKRPRRTCTPKPSERDQRLVLLKSLLHDGNYTKRSMALTLGISRSTLNRYIATIEAVRA